MVQNPKSCQTHLTKLPTSPRPMRKTCSSCACWNVSTSSQALQTHANVDWLSNPTWSIRVNGIIINIIPSGSGKHLHNYGEKNTTSIGKQFLKGPCLFFSIAMSAAPRSPTEGSDCGILKVGRLAGTKRKIWLCFRR